jgi:hypothetical protein
MIYSQVIVQPLKGDKYKLLEDLQYKTILVPKGYETNGANIPRLFWAIYPPNKSDFLPAVIIHDYLCDKEEYKKADDLFEECLKELGIKSFDLSVLVKSVRIYHKIKYKI